MVGAVFNRDSLGLLESYVLPSAVDFKKVIWSIDHVLSVIRDSTAFDPLRLRGDIEELVQAVVQRFSALLTLNL